MAEIHSSWMVPEPVHETFENHNMATGYLHYFEIVGDDSDDNDGNGELLPTIGFKFNGIHPHAKLEIIDTDNVDQIQYFKRGIHYGLRFGQVELRFSKPEPNVCIATVYIEGARSRNSIRIKCATYTRMVNYIRGYLPAAPAAVVVPAPPAALPAAALAPVPAPAPPAEPSANNEPYEPNMPAPSERRRKGVSMRRGTKKQRKTRRHRK